MACVNNKVNISCGFGGVNPAIIKVIWYVARRNSDVMIVHGEDLLNGTNGLQWILDTTSGSDISPNSKLIVGPVNEYDDQSTYQCSIELPGVIRINSTTAFLTVIGMLHILWFCSNWKICV